MRKLLYICYGVLKSQAPFDATLQPGTWHSATQHLKIKFGATTGRFFALESTSCGNPITPPVLILEMASSDPEVSVVMAVCDERPYVEEAVQSILRQTFRDFECIIVNDGSTDGTKEVLEQLADRDDRIRLVHQENLGLPTAVNRGLDKARGTYVARMDGDDISRPERLDRQVQFLSSHPEVGVVGTSAEYVDAEGEATGTTWHPPTDPDLISWKLLFNTCLCNPSTMIRRNLFDKVGDYACWAWPSEDYEWWTRACRVSRLTNLPSTLLKLRRHEGSVSVSERRKQIRKCAKAASNFHRALLGKEAENQMSAFLVWMSIEGIERAVEETDVQDLSATHEYLRTLYRTHVRHMLSGGTNVVARQRALLKLDVIADRISEHEGWMQGIYHRIRARCMAPTREVFLWGARAIRRRIL